MKISARELYKRVVSTHNMLHEMIVRINQELTQETEPKELADYAFALHKAAELADDTRKELTKSDNLAQRKACYECVVAGVHGPIKTEYTTATLDIKTCVRIPRKSAEPEAYAKLMQYLGVPEDLYNCEEEKEILRPHWPGLMELVSRLCAEGKPLPPGIDPDATFPEYRLKMRQSKHIS